MPALHVTYRKSHLTRGGYTMHLRTLLRPTTRYGLRLPRTRRHLRSWGRMQLCALYDHTLPEDKLNHRLGVTQSLIHLDEETTFLMSINNEHSRIAIYRKTDELKFFNLLV